MWSGWRLPREEGSLECLRLFYSLIVCGVVVRFIVLGLQQAQLLREAVACAFQSSSVWWLAEKGTRQAFPSQFKQTSGKKHASCPKSGGAEVCAVKNRCHVKLRSEPDPKAPKATGIFELSRSLISSIQSAVLGRFRTSVVPSTPYQPRW